MRKITCVSGALDILVIFFSISLFFFFSLSLSLSLSAFYSLSLHMSFACHKHLDSRLLTSRHAFFQRSIVNFLQRCVNATRANPAEPDDGEKKKTKILHRTRGSIYIPRWSHPFRRENGQWHRRMLSRGFRWSPIVGGQSDARVKSPYQFLYVSKLMNIDGSIMRYEQIFYFSLFTFYFYCINTLQNLSSEVY